MNTPAAATVLTREDIKALRESTSVTFNVYNGVGYMHAYKRSYRDGGVYTMTEQRLFPETGGGIDERLRRIETEHAVMGYGTNDTRKWTHESDPSVLCFVYGYDSAKDTMATIFGLLQPGNTIRLSWVADNNNGNAESAGFHTDELYMHIQRDGKPPLSFLVTKETAPDNSARMIRRHG